MLEIAVVALVGCLAVLLWLEKRRSNTLLQLLQDQAEVSRATWQLQAEMHARERKELYDRIQASSLAEFKHLNGEARSPRTANPMRGAYSEEYEPDQ